MQALASSLALPALGCTRPASLSGRDTRPAASAGRGGVEQSWNPGSDPFFHGPGCTWSGGARGGQRGGARGAALSAPFPPQPRSSVWETRCWGWPRSACR